MKYSVKCYKAGTYKIWKTIEVEADSIDGAEDIASDSFWASKEIITSNEDVELDLDSCYSECIARKV